MDDAEQGRAGTPPAAPADDPGPDRPPFIPGAELCRLFYVEAVRPIIERRFPRPINHGVTLADAPRLLRGWTGIDVLEGWPPRTEDWLTAPEHHLRTVVCGPVYRDDTGELALARERLRWYPRDVWLYLMAAVWKRISQEEVFPGRCGDVGDEAGSLIVAGRLVRDMMRLAFLMERQYAPYGKWLGSAFNRLACAPRLTPSLLGALKAETWQERDRHLAAAYESAAELHNALDSTPPLDAKSGPRYPERPYLGITAGRFTESLTEQIRDEPLRRLAQRAHGLIGSTGLWIDSTDALGGGWRAAHLRQYRDALDASGAQSY